MNVHYSIGLKRKLCTDICIHDKSTIHITHEYGISLKTLEKWITVFNKDNHYSSLSDNIYIIKKRV